MEEGRGSTEEIEPIVPVLPTLNKRIELPEGCGGACLGCGRCGVTNDPKEYVMQMLERALAKQDKPIEESASGETTPEGAIPDQ